MQCPIDGSDLVISERQGIEIDYCPKCRGIWLDRGELDKLLERESQYYPAQASAPAASPAAPGRRYDDDDDDDWDERRGYDDRSGRRPKKRRSLLGEIFDFG